jgi:hypothetical protein
MQVVAEVDLDGPVMNVLGFQGMVLISKGTEVQLFKLGAKADGSPELRFHCAFDSNNVVRCSASISVAGAMSATAIAVANAATGMLTQLFLL